MAQSGFTPIQLYRTATASAAPSAGNLADGELAINTNDGRLFYKDSGGVVRTIASSASTSGVFAPGTVSAPGITFTGDTNTGIYSPAADTIAFTEGGVEAMRLDASGNVGIGTTAPTARLNIVDNTSQDALRITQTGAGNALVVEDSANPDASPFVVNADGNVGIGTAAPGTALDVSGAGFIRNTRFNATAAYVQRRANGTAAAPTIVSNNDSQFIRFDFYDGASYLPGAAIFGEVDGTPGTNDMPGRLVFSTTADGASSATERMRIDNQGRVGIGGLPFDRLDVHGGTTVRGILDVRSSGAQMLWATNTYGGFSLTNGTVSSALALNTNQAELRGISNHPYVFYTNNLERMRIDASGNVGIGTSAPAELLDVNSSSATATYNDFVAFRQTNGSGTFTRMLFGQNTTNNMFVDVANEVNTKGNLLLLPFGGNVGIGTGTPSYRLSAYVNSNAADVDVAQVVSDANPTGTSITHLRLEKGGGFGGTIGGYIAQGVGSGLVLSTLNGGTRANQMWITNAGNVGIGTGTTPGYRLDVAFAGDNGARIRSSTLGSYLVFENVTGAVVANSSNTPLSFTTNNLERMRIDASGNVMIGTSSPIDFGKLSISCTAQPGVAISGSNYVSYALRATGTGGREYRLTSTDNANGLGGGKCIIYDETAAAARLTIDSTGNVGINTLSPGARLDVAGFTRLGRYGGAFQGVTLVNDDNSASSETISFIDTQNNLLVADTNIFFGHQTDGGSYISFATTPPGSRSSDRRQERMRLMANGQFYIGTTTPRIAARISVENNGFAGYFACTGTGGGNIPLIVERYSDDGIAIEFKRSNAVVGSVSVTSTATAYNTSSDYRLKENVVPLTGAAARVQALKPSRFNFIADPDRVVDGFIAHEAAEVVPEAVSGEKDAVNEDGSIKAQGIDHSKLVPLLTAALQEALSRIETLEARVAALENR